MARVSKNFGAAYDSECSECGADIYECDTIAMYDGSAICEECADEIREQDKRDRDFFGITPDAP